MRSEEYYRSPRLARLYGSGPCLGTNQDYYLLWLVSGTGDHAELLTLTSAERDSILALQTAAFAQGRVLSPLSKPSTTFSDMNERNTWTGCLLTDPVATEGTVI